MTLVVAPSEDAINTALRSFLVFILPPDVDVILAQVNRVPEPAGEDFVTMTPLRRPRIGTNIDDYADAVFTGSIAGTTLNITAVGYGELSVGSVLFGVGITAGTRITALGTGAGGVGTYIVSPGQTISSRKIAAGVETFLQPTNITMQLDVHGPNSADNAQTISTLMRDDYAVQAFAALNADVIPLFADDPRQLAFSNAEQQYEDRWVVEAQLQANITITAPLQFADAIEVTLIPVETIQATPWLDFSDSDNSQYLATIVLPQALMIG